MSYTDFRGVGHVEKWSGEVEWGDYLNSLSQYILNIFNFFFIKNPDVTQGAFLIIKLY